MTSGPRTTPPDPRPAKGCKTAWSIARWPRWRFGRNPSLAAAWHIGPFIIYRPRGDG